MNRPADNIQTTAGKTTALSYILRVLWIVIRLLAVLVLLNQGDSFFYQGF